MKEQDPLNSVLRGMGGPGTAIRRGRARSPRPTAGNRPSLWRRILVRASDHPPSPCAAALRFLAGAGAVAPVDVPAGRAAARPVTPAGTGYMTRIGTDRLKPLPDGATRASDPEDETMNANR